MSTASRASLALLFAALTAAIAVVLGCGHEPEKVSAAFVVDATPPAVPDGLVAMMNETGAVLLHWDANLTDCDLVGYIVYRSEQAAGVFGPRQTLPLPTNSWRDEDVSPRRTYVYRVAARDASNNESDMSPECRVTVPRRRTPSRAR
jgi:hypothetical protein